MFSQIIATIDRFEGDFAVLRHKDHEMLWPAEDLPADSKEGEVLTLTAMTEQEATKSRAETAKLILNDVLNEALEAPGTLPPRIERIEMGQSRRLNQIDKDLQGINEELKRNRNE